MKKMNFKTLFALASVFLLLLVGLGHSAVACGGVNMYVKPPDSWTTLWYEAGGQWTQVPSTAKQPNGFWKFNMTGGQGDNFVFGQNTGYHPNTWIDVNVYAVENAQSRVNFKCADLTGADYYISEDPTQLGKTYASINPPNAKYFYFLPPDESEWFQGSALAIINGTDTVKMIPDDVRCGWYKLVYFNEEPPTNILFTLDLDPDAFVLGDEGVDAVADPIPVNLSARFSTINPTGTELFFNPEEGTVGWYATDPGDVRQCNYDLAATIFDSDASLHSGFSCYASGSVNACGTAHPWISKCIGVTKNIVQSTLGANRKPIYNDASGCFEGSASFNQLFTNTPGVNVEHCYDLPFTRTSDGLWEFDSFNSYDGGFYPLEDQPNSGASTKRYAECRVPLLPAWSIVQPGTGLPRFDTLTALNGMFADGDNPGVWDWGNRKCRLSGAVPAEKGADRNQQFCFASNADFIYRKGQVFSFRGDDDIWVYINNQLVVDLGGTHLAAPGYVKLDDLGLELGKSYPIDIFFCDRRTTMSNVRIKTNMYFEQKKSLYWKKVGDTYTLEKLETGGSGCAGLKNDNEVIVPGSQLQLSYLLISTRGDTLDGDPSTPNVKDPELATGVTVYGGIFIENGAVKLDTTKLSGLAPGRYRITIFERGDPSAKTTITIKISGNTGFYSVKGSQATLTQNPAVDTLAGRLVPFQVAKMFDNLLDNSEASFILTIPEGLTVYKDSLGKVPVVAGQTISTDEDGSVEDGVITLYATGSRKVLADTVTYTLSIKGSKNPPLYLKFHQPRLAFVADSVSVTPLGHPKPALGSDKGNFAFVNIPTYLIAYDPADGTLCYDCNDTLTTTTKDSLSFSSVDGGSVLVLKNGRMVLRVRGVGNVSNGSFIVDGPSKWMQDNWTGINLERPPVPVPTFAAMYDRNSDGIADSLHISFDRSIKDTVPDFVVLRWPSAAPDTLILQGLTKVLLDRTTSDTLLEPLFPTTNTNQILPLLSTNGKELSMEYPYDKIDTRSTGQVDAWFTFKNKAGQIFQQPITADIQDRMSPIVARVRIKIAQGAHPFDTLRVVFSEPIDTTGFINGITPFEYRLLTSKDSLAIKEIPAILTVFRPSLDTMWVMYNKNSEVGTTPKSGDSLRITIITNSFVIKDLQGNVRSNDNPFVLIEGDKRNEIATIPLAAINKKTAQERIKSKSPTFTDKVGIYDDINKVKSYLSAKHGPVLGHIIKTDLSEVFSKYSAQYEFRAKKPLTPADVVLNYEVTYLTSIGGYVASGKGQISCADKTFFEGNCNSNRNGYIFVGWNAVSDDMRLAGSGAYVARIRTWVSIPVLGKIAETSLTEDELWGVMRGEGVIK